MCLSTVYTDNKNEDSVVVNEASQVTADENGRIEISTLFGDTQVLEGYFVAEINLMKNFVVLHRR